MNRKHLAVGVIALAALAVLSALSNLIFPTGARDGVCEETGLRLSNQEIVYRAVRLALEEGLIVASTDDADTYLDQHPDCCYLRSRDKTYDGRFGPMESGVSDVVIYVDAGAPDSSADAAGRLYEHGILLSACGEPRGHGLREVSAEHRNEAKRLQLLNFQEN